MLQALLNKVLSLDANLLPYLLRLEGKPVAITCTDTLPQTIYAAFDNQQIILSSSKPARIDVTISGTLRDFVKYAITKQKGALHISGDAMVAGLIEDLYLHMEIDWEEELSKFTGDAVAYQSMSIFRQLKQYVGESSATLGAMITEYLQEESDILPTHHEVADFMHDVDELRLRVDRLEAGIKAHESN